LSYMPGGFLLLEPAADGKNPRPFWGEEVVV
jgi:hypothetical protein